MLAYRPHRLPRLGRFAPDTPVSPSLTSPGVPGHWRGCLAASAACRLSISLCPLAPGPLRPFTATMDTLTSTERLLVSAGESEHRAGPRRPLRFMALAFTTVPSPTTPQASRTALSRYPSASGPSSRYLGTSGLRRSAPDSPAHVAESCSPGLLSHSPCYGPVFHLLLLSTSPRGDAVAVGYGPENLCPERTCTPLT
jgi:hypothetical protein